VSCFGARPAGSSLLSAGLVLWLSACGEDPVAVELEVIEEVTFAESLGIDLSQMTKLPSGVYIEDRVAGTDVVLVAGDVAVVAYAGWLKDGSLFDSGEFPFVFGASPRQVIEGFESGVEGMAVGGTRLIIIPPELAYGLAPPNGSSIPPGAILVFQVELLDIGRFQVIEETTFGESLGIDLAEMTKLSSGVYIRDDVVGDGLPMLQGDFVEVTQNVWLSDGALVDSGPLAFTFDAQPSQLSIEGIELGMAGMAEGGIRLIIVPPELAFGTSPPSNSPIPYGAILVFQIEVLAVN